MNFRNAATRHLFDLPFQLDERHHPVIGQHLPESGFAGAAQTDKGHALPPRRLAGRLFKSIDQRRARLRQFRLRAATQDFPNFEPFSRRNGFISYHFDQSAVQDLTQLAQELD